LESIPALLVVNFFPIKQQPGINCFIATAKPAIAPENPQILESNLLMPSQVEDVQTYQRARSPERM
jgi:hypothetical protein